MFRDDDISSVDSNDSSGDHNEEHALLHQQQQHQSLPPPPAAAVDLAPGKASMQNSTTASPSSPPSSAGAAFRDYSSRDPSEFFASPIASSSHVHKQQQPHHGSPVASIQPIPLPSRLSYPIHGPAADEAREGTDAGRIAASALEALRQSLLQLDRSHTGGATFDSSDAPFSANHQESPMLGDWQQQQQHQGDSSSPERHVNNLIYTSDDDGDGDDIDTTMATVASTTGRAGGYRRVLGDTGGVGGSEVDVALIKAIWGVNSSTDDVNTTTGGDESSSPAQQRPSQESQQAAIGDLSLWDLVASYESGTGCDLPPYVVCVQALDQRTTSKALQENFFPVGSVSAVVVVREDEVVALMHATATVILDSLRTENDPSTATQLPAPYPQPSLIRRRIAGLAFFKTRELASFAAYKMHDFVPHGQSSPLHAAFALGTQLAEAIRSYQRDPAGCVERMRLMQPSLTEIRTNTSTAHSELQPAAAGTAVNRRLVATIQSMFSGMPKPLADLSSNELRFASLLAEAETGRGHERIAAPCTALLEACLNNSDADDLNARDVVTLLAEAIGTHHRGVLRVVELLARRVSDIMTASTSDTLGAPSRATLLQTRLVTPLTKLVLKGLVYSEERLKRIGCAVAAASLFEHGILTGSPFEMCSRLFTQKIIVEPPSPQREGLAEALVILAACTKTCVRMRGGDPSSAPDLLAGPLQYPNPGDAPPTDEAEKEFQRVLVSYRAAAADVTTHVVPYQAGWPNQRPDEVLPSVRPTLPARSSPSAAHNVSTASDGRTHTPPRAPVPLPPASTTPIRIPAVTGQPLLTPEHHHTSAPPSANVSSGAISSTLNLSRDGPSGGLRHPLHEPVSPVVVTTTTAAPSTLQADILPCTVFVTRIPAALSDQRLRTLLMHHGELNKVRLNPAKRTAAAAGEPNYTEMVFAFVEFRTPTGARNLVNGLDRAKLYLVGTSPEHATWLVTPHGEEPDIMPDSQIFIQTTLRCSPAHSAIHDHDPRDAVFDASGKIRECLFGVLPRVQPPRGSGTVTTGPPRTPTSQPAAAVVGVTVPVAAAPAAKTQLNAAAEPWARGSGDGDGPLPSERRIVVPRRAAPPSESHTDPV